MSILTVKASDEALALAIGIRHINPYSDWEYLLAIRENIRFVEGQESTRVAGCNLHRINGNEWSLSPHHFGEDTEAAEIIKSAKMLLSVKNAEIALGQNYKRVLTNTER